MMMWTCRLDRFACALVEDLPVKRGRNQPSNNWDPKAFPRLRMGIGQPPGRMDSADYVLQPFEKADEQVLNEFIERASDAAKCFITDGLDTAMNRFNPKI